MIETLLEWIGPAFIHAGYPIIATAIFLERTILLGLIVPGEVILATGGIFASRGELDIAWVVALGILAGLAGESAGYWLGRRYGRRLIHSLPLVRRLERSLTEAERFFEEHGGKTIAIGRFATAAGAFVPFTAGTARVPYSRFALYDVPSVLVWATGVALLGFFLGENVETVDRVLSRFGWAILGLMVVLLAVRWWRRRSRPDRAPRRRTGS